MNVSNNNQTQTTTVQYRSHSLVKHAGKPGTAARTRRKERREHKRWKQAQVKEAQTLRYAQYLFFHTMVWEAYEDLCYAQEGMHYVQLGIVQAQVMKLQMEAVLQVGKSPKPTRMEKVWNFMKQEVKVPPIMEAILIGVISLSIAAPIAVNVTSHTEVTVMNPDIMGTLR